MSTATQSIEQLAINTIRTLAMDGVQAANSGHPGTPMALAPVAHELWTQYLNYDPKAPLWPNRDRYILSCGHASMLVYSLIHLASVRRVDESGKVTDQLSLPLDELKNFRQWKSLTPGHPEFRHTSGVETTTGPLGQGCGNGVGMAIASRWLAERYNRKGFPLFDFNVWVQCSDGDLMEGVSCEAASLAGHLKLSNLCWVYDDNQITIEGSTDLAFSEDVAMRFQGLGWHVRQVDDANDQEALTEAYQSFLAHDDGPTIIIVKSEIGYGAPNAAGTSEAHGAPLGDEEIALTKKAYDWPNEKFHVPAEVPEHFTATLGKRGGEAREKWDAMFSKYQKEHPALAEELRQMWAGELPDGWDAALPTFEADAKGMATRGSGGKALNGVAKQVPWLIGGSADLAPSTKTLVDGAEDFAAGSYGGRNFHFGIREHAMAAAVNGMTLCGVRAYGATFFVFSDYLRPSMRLAAIMGLPSIFVFTHDSIGVGEDGPTHQPVEQLAACRAIPNLVVLRPGDANEVSQAWRAAMLESKRPVALVLTRQNLPTLCRDKFASADGVARGGYILADAPGGKPSVVLLATGSELSLAVEAHEQLTADGVASRVVSMPSQELFDDQPEPYRNEVLPPDVTARIVIEAGIRQCWDKYLGFGGTFIGVETFGTSAPYAEIYKQRGLTADAIVDAAKSLVG
jgi:transketolase